jgi:DHA2 family multidrug resistance protein
MSASGTMNGVMAGNGLAQASPDKTTRPVNPWIIAVTVTLATFMEMLDTSISNVALPHIAGSMGAGQDESTWVLTSYLVSNAIVIPLSAWFMTTIGRKRFYMSCVALFTLSSLACGLAPSLGWLIFFRVLQGIGGGGLAPCEQAILVDTFPAAQRASAFSVYSFAVITAPAMGPIVGGWITDNWSWRWVFLVNIPVGALSLFLSSRLLHDPPWMVEKARQLKAAGKSRVDYIGISLFALGLGCLQVVLDKGERDDWFGSRFICGFAAVAVLSLVIGIVWEWRNKNAAIDLTLLKERNFALACALYFVTLFILMASTLLVPLLLQSGFGYTATLAGFVLSPGAFVLLILTVVVAKTVRRVGPKALAVPGLLVLAVASFYMSRSIEPGLDYRTAAFARILLGVGLAGLFVPNSLIAYSRLPAEKNNRASSLTQLFRNLGGSFGIALVTTFLARRSQFHQTVLAPHISAYNPWAMTALNNQAEQLRSAGLSESDAFDRAQAMVSAVVSQQANLLAYRDIFWLLGIMALVSVPLVLLVRKGKSATPPEGAH